MNSLSNDAETDVVLNDDLRLLATDAQGCFCAVSALVLMLQRAGSEAEPVGLVDAERRGLAELLDGVRLRLEGVVEMSEQLVRVFVGEESPGA